MNYPSGLVVGPHGGTIDNSPAVGVRDCLRKAATAPELMPDADHRAAEEVERAQIECFGMLAGIKCHMVAHRVAADRMRVRMIERLQAAHRPPAERDPCPEYLDAEDRDTTARSRVFREAETGQLHPIDKTAALVAGSE